MNEGGMKNEWRRDEEWMKEGWIMYEGGIKDEWSRDEGLILCLG